MWLSFLVSGVRVRSEKPDGSVPAGARLMGSGGVFLAHRKNYVRAAGARSGYHPAISPHPRLSAGRRARPVSDRPRPFSNRYRRRTLLYRQVPFGLQLPEQQSASLPQGACLAPQVQSTSLLESQLGPQQPSATPQAGKMFSHPDAGSQESVVQVSPSSQSIGALEQPVTESQVSAVQALPSLQLTGL